MGPRGYHWGSAPSKFAARVRILLHLQARYEGRVYHHLAEKHLQRYLDEFDFRYGSRVALGENDSERATRAIKGAEGKRLTYRNPCGAKDPISGRDAGSHTKTSRAR